jgi:hypothetical protein
LQKPLPAPALPPQVSPEISTDVEMDSGDLTESVPHSASFEVHPPPPLFTNSGRPRRNYRMPERYVDVLPEGPVPVPPTPVPAQAPIIRRVILHVRDILRTGLNRFGVFREYPHRPSYDPDSFVSPDDLSISHKPTPPEQFPIPPNNDNHPPPWPFTNMTVYRFMEWMTTGSNQKSHGEVDRLAKDVIGAPDFKAEDLAGFSAHREIKRFDSSEPSGNKAPFLGDNWKESSVPISIPTGLRDPSGQGQDFVIPELHHRSLVGVMKAALADISARKFHFSPFKRFKRMPSGHEERCIDEVYTSDAFLEAHDKLQKQPNEPGCKLEKVVLGLMFWSDSTHLANFGTAKVWPLYMYFANLSKYIRGKPGSGASHHVAYIPSVRLIHYFI